jgi:hypothetical protein
MQINSSNPPRFRVDTLTDGDWVDSLFLMNNNSSDSGASNVNIPCGSSRPHSAAFHRDDRDDPDVAFAVSPTKKQRSGRSPIATDSSMSDCSSDHERKERMSPMDSLDPDTLYKLKNRDNARKNRLKKKAYVTALEEGLVKMVGAVSSLRNVVSAQVGEAVIPSHVTNLVNSAIESVRDHQYNGRSMGAISDALGKEGIKTHPPKGNNSDAADSLSQSITAPIIEESVLNYILSLQTGFFILNPNLVGDPLIFVDAGFERMTGYTKEELWGKNISALMEVSYVNLTVLA